MLVFFYNATILLAAGGGSGGGGFTDFYNTYLNYPGFEVWKFINLAIFAAILVYLLKKPLSDAFKAKRESIRAELIKAEEEKKAALAQLTTAEAKLVSLDPEKSAVLKKAQDEATAEKIRLATETESEINKMRDQSAGEITRLSQVTRIELRRFSAEESIRLAEQKLRATINADNDARLVKTGIEAIGGMN